jgi:hypothetical protein
MLFHFLHGNFLIHLFLILLFHFLIDHQSHGRLTIPGKIGHDVKLPSSTSLELNRN